MNEARIYETKIDKIYVDFYKKDVGFISTFDKTIDRALSGESELENRAIRRIIKDVYSLDLSKVEVLTDLL